MSARLAPLHPRPALESTHRRSLSLEDEYSALHILQRGQCCKSLELEHYANLTGFSPDIASMGDSDNAGAPPSPPSRRKSFVEMLNPRAFGSASSATSASPSIAIPTSPGASNNGRKSISLALGLSGSGNAQESPYNAYSRQRRASVSTSSAGGSPEFRNSFDDNAVIEDDDKVGPMNSPPSPSLGRRLSFGAQALRDVRQGGTSPSNNAGRRSSSYLSTLSEDANPDNRHRKPNTRPQGTAKTGGKSQGRSPILSSPVVQLHSVSDFNYTVPLWLGNMLTTCRRRLQLV